MTSTWRHVAHNPTRIVLNMPQPRPGVEPSKPATVKHRIPDPAPNAPLANAGAAEEFYTHNYGVIP
jgi:hypothetical protein